MSIFNRTFGSTLIVAGTAIGVGMLVLPILLASFGILKSLLIFTLAYIIMVYVALAFYEASLVTHEPRANVTTIAKIHFGNTGKILAFTFYSVYLYVMAIAYFNGIANLTTKMWPLPIPYEHDLFILILASVVGSIIIFGMHLVDIFNRYLMATLITCFIIIVSICSYHIHWQNYHVDTAPIKFGPLPIVMVALVFHIVIPSLKNYLKQQHRAIMRAMIIGSLLVLTIYMIWTFVLLGVIPLHHGLDNMSAIQHARKPLVALTESLSLRTHAPWLFGVYNIFAVLAMLTSLIAASICLFELFTDRLTEDTQHPWRLRLLIGLAVIVPSVLVSLFGNDLFVVLLKYAGEMVIVLYGILPILMVFKLRYINQQTMSYQAPGKGYALIMALAILLLVMYQSFPRPVA